MKFFEGEHLLTSPPTGVTKRDAALRPICERFTGQPTCKTFISQFRANKENRTKDGLSD
jgi:hypothetical protein